MKLLIHHHAPVFVNSDGLHVQSFIGAWVQELATYFEEVGILFNETRTKRETQDYKISAKNVILHALPENRGISNRAIRGKAIAKAGKSLDRIYDVLLIRGITPKQLNVFNSFKKIRKVFLLVGSLEQSKPEFGWKAYKMYVWLMYFKRKNEFIKISLGAELLANSPILVEEIEKSTKKLASYIPTNTISFANFKKVERNYTGGQINLLYVGRVTEEKGIFELVKAVTQLSLPAITFRLDIIGPFRQEIKNRIRLLTKKHKNLPVCLHGYIPFGKDLFTFYQQAQIYILPSYHEGFPHSIWEAAAFNLPIITTKVGGIPGVVNNSQVYFIKAKSDQEIIKAIFEVLKKEDKRNSRIKNMYKLAVENTVEKSASKMADYLMQSARSY